MAQSTHHRHYQAFLDLLKAWRAEAGLTQSEVGERLGNTQTFVSKVERGERRLDLVEFTEWCEALGVAAESAFQQFLKVRAKERDRKISARRRSTR